MAGKFLAVMADLDEGTQKQMSSWYASLQEAGFKGVQTPDLPYHITMAILPLDMEGEAVSRMQKVAAEFPEFPVHLSHIGMFAGGRVLFAATERDPRLNEFHEALEFSVPQEHPWTPHATLIIDEPETIQKAMPLVVKSFKPLPGKVTRLHLCEFQPKREIASIDLLKGL
ncbi:MAG: 2'-5' RNA ligase family protein [Ruminococcaceae bacterium]|nr:2'-5' RNA ligase family protein [Oscillospiraceae bacterium]